MALGEHPYLLEPFSSQLTQLISEPDCCGFQIRFRFRSLIPAAQRQTQFWEQKTLNCLVDSCGVRPFEHLKQIVCGDQGTDLTQFIGKTSRPGKIALVTLLQLRVCEIHNASSMQREVVSDIGPRRKN